MYKKSRRNVEVFKPIPFRRRRVHCPIPRSTFTTYMDEGNMHFRSGSFHKALNCYDRALELRPAHKGALVARSQCHLRMGDALSALQDAEASFDKLNEKTSIVGIFQFGDALFNLGFFEKALIVFTKGYRLRRDVENFRIGIQKAQNAIRVSIGERSATQMEDYEQILPRLKEELLAMNSPKPDHCCIRPDGRPYNRGLKLSEPNPRRARWVSREILGEMSYDKDYLKMFLKRPDIRTDVGSALKLKKSAAEALKFLNVREKFWRQETPMYARKKGLNFNDNMVLQFEAQERQRQEAVRHVKMEAAEGSVFKNIALIEHDLAIGRPNDCRLQCDRALRQMKKLTLGLCPRKPEFACRIHHYKGLALMKMKKFDKCLETFSDEYDIASAANLIEYKIQALNFMGQTNAMKRSFMDACEIWETMLSTARTSLERAYLFHEIGRCYFEMNKPDIAQYYCQQCLDESAKINDKVWLMNGRVFMAQIELKYMNLDKAMEYFQSAEMMARQCNVPNSQILREVIHCMDVWMEKIEHDRVLAEGSASAHRRRRSSDGSDSSNGSPPKI